MNLSAAPVGIDQRLLVWLARVISWILVSTSCVPKLEPTIGGNVSEPLGPILLCTRSPRSMDLVAVWPAGRPLSWA